MKPNKIPIYSLHSPSKLLHRNSSFSQKSNNTGLSLCFRPQVLPGKEEDGGGEPGDGGVQGGHHAHGEGSGGRGQCPQTGSLRVVTSVLPCGENPSWCSSGLKHHLRVVEGIVMSWVADEPRILPRVMGNHNGLLVWENTNKCWTFTCNYLSYRQLAAGIIASKCQSHAIWNL